MDSYSVYRSEQRECQSLQERLVGIPKHSALFNPSVVFWHPELWVRQQKGLIDPKTLLMAVDDSKFNIGSGSAALNALICVAENLAAIEGHKVAC